MDIQNMRRCAIALLLPLFMRNTNTWEFLTSAFLVLIMTLISAKVFNRTFNRDLILPITATAIASLFATFVADYIVTGEWMRLFVTYVLALEGVVSFELRDGCRVVGDSLAKMSLLPSTFFPGIDAISYSSIRTFDVTRPADYVFSIIGGLAITTALWPNYNAGRTMKLLLCIGIVFCTVTLLFLKLAAVITHISTQHLRQEKEAAQCRLRGKADKEQRRVTAVVEIERGRIDKEKQQQVDETKTEPLCEHLRKAAFEARAVESMRVDVERQRLVIETEGREERIAAEEKRKLKEWKADDGIPDLNVIDSDIEAGKHEPKSPEEKAVGVKGLGRSARPLYNVNYLFPLDTRSKTRKKKRMRKETIETAEDKKLVEARPAVRKQNAARKAGVNVMVGEKPPPTMVPSPQSLLQTRPDSDAYTTRESVNDVSIMQLTPREHTERPPAATLNSLQEMPSVTADDDSILDPQRAKCNVVAHVSQAQNTSVLDSPLDLPSTTTSAIPNLSPRSDAKLNETLHPHMQPSLAPTARYCCLQAIGKEELDNIREWWNDVFRGRFTVLGEVNDLEMLRKMVESLRKVSAVQPRPSTRRRG